MLPTVDFFGTSVTRLIVGDNPFSGHSYIPDITTGQEMMDYYSADNIVKALFAAEQAGYNTYLPLGDPFILRVIRQYRNEGGKMHLLFQPYPVIDLSINIRQMMTCRPLAIYHQGTTTDSLIEAGKFDALRDNIKRIKDTGLPTGLGTHVPETILRAEDGDWGIDFYMACVHNTRKRGGEPSSFISGREKTIRFFAEDRPEMYKVIKQVSKPCIAYKILAGGQLFFDKKEAEIPAIIETALLDTFSNIKPYDLATIGIYQKLKNQLAENSVIAEKVLAGLRE